MSIAERLDLRTSTVAAAAVVALAAAVVLIPWTGYLAVTLPAVHLTSTWAGTWVGFDIALLAALAVTGVLGLRRHPAFASAAMAAATLLATDAWFDIMTSTGAERWAAVASAVLVELPLGMVLARAALAPRRVAAPAGL